MKMNRRALLNLMLTTGLLAIMPRMVVRASDQKFPKELTADEWKKKLSPAAYNVLREEGTEPAYSSPLNDEHGKGVFSCAGCDTDLFSSDTKFDSGTGWPSFYAPLNSQVIGTTTDYKLILPRVEVHCNTCGGHLGHVFEDGPKPTGLRYCMNGVALKFKANKA